ncbi:hypothetical protein EV360DRAFT_67614 [Lentinula raphanica]|nr:hypothetical protein EV360DRAFT_67614 [Lentinula raphanica]
MSLDGCERRRQASKIFKFQLVKITFLCSAPLTWLCLFAGQSAAIPTPGVQSTPSTTVKVYISSGREPSGSRSSFSAVPGCDLKFDSMQKLHAALIPVIQKAVPASGSMIPSNWVPVFWSAPSVYWTNQAGYIIPFSVSFDDNSLKNMNTGSGQIKLSEDTHSGHVFWREGEAVKIEIDEKTVLVVGY